MIEIREHGKFWNGHSDENVLTNYEIKCPYCNCVFRCEHSDITYDQREGDCWIYCPECNKDLDPRKYSTLLFKQIK